MKSPSRFIAVGVTAIIVALFSVAGCGSTGIERSNKASTTMQTVDSDIKLVAVQLDATGASLDELMKPGQTDVKKAFELYSGNVTKIEKMEKEFAKHSDEMKSRGKDYFTEWKKEGDAYKNPEIQALSEQRRVELGEIYGRIAASSVGVKDAFRTYVSDVKEIQMFLSNDLTPKGINAIAPTSNRVVGDGDRLKYAIKDVQTAIERAREEMAQRGS